ncbi:uncharacterized protein LOC144584493 isoform X2 [Pogona vitticeps]
MLKAGLFGFCNPCVPTFSFPRTPPLPRCRSGFKAGGRQGLHWTLRHPNRGRWLGVVLSVSSFTRMQSFIVRLRHLATSRNDRIQKGRRDMASCLQSPSQLGFESRGGDS